MSAPFAANGTIPPKPVMPPLGDLASIPAFAQLAERDQFVNWEYQLKLKGNGSYKWDKPPVDAKNPRRGESPLPPADATFPADWLSLNEAVARAKSTPGVGIGYALSSDDD